MNQEKPKRPVRTLSIRIPQELYLNISQYGIDKDMPSMNATIISLINQGIAAVEGRDSTITKFILELIPEEKLKELASGTIKT